MKNLLRFLLFILIIRATHAGEVRMLVHKSERNLSVFIDDVKTHTFRVALGGAPDGDKEKSGDGKTPEGTFYICVKNPKSRFYLSLGISYPDMEDAARGLSSGLISNAEHDRIQAAQQEKMIPPWNTQLGGEIFIHGHGSSPDWTLGCIALDDSDMKLLFELIEVGATIEIKP